MAMPVIVTVIRIQRNIGPRESRQKRALPQPHQCINMQRARADYRLTGQVPAVVGRARDFDGSPRELSAGPSSPGGPR
jgi:hypothetical protein